MTEDIHNLLGGYATGTLTEAERKALFDAALDDQELFSALADEEKLRELLDDPAARAEVIRSLEASRGGAWWKWPAVAVSAATIALVFSVVILRDNPTKPARYARVEPPPSATIARAPEASSAPAAAGPLPGARGSARFPSRGRHGAVSRQLSTAAKDNTAAQPLAQSVAVNDREAGPVRYSVLKRGLDGNYAAVDPAAEFAEGDELRLKLTASQPGSLLVKAGEQILFAGRVARDTAYTFPPNGSIPAGNMDFRISLSGGEGFTETRLDSSTLMPRQKAASARSPGEAVQATPEALPVRSPASPVEITISIRVKAR